MTPWLSVIMPVHNGANYLADALAGISAENPDGVEVLIYNSAEDGGAARRIADRFAGRLDIVWRDTPELDSWTRKTNRGVADARADYVVVLPHDDLWLPGHLAELRRAIATDPDVALSVANVRYAGADGRLLGLWHVPFAPGRVRGEEFAATLLVQNNVCVTSALIRRDAFLACGGVDETLWYTGDWDLYLKLARRGDVRVRKAVTTAYRVHGGALTISGSRDEGEFRRQHEIVLARHPAALASTRGLERRARTGIAVNCALAAASAGRFGALPRVMVSLVGLGPLGLARFLAQSRIIDRLRPRLRMRLGLGGAS
ncbi:MAG: glycosyltransferase [Novosphingobium sp.]|nr:glycosyltransferase [Novosphingobium sp.]